MVVVYIKKQQFFKNVDEFGNIFEIEYPTIEIEQNGEIIKTTYDNYIENGFTKVELEDKYFDCKKEDFNENLTFSIEKYNSRKQKETALKRIVELKDKLISTDYQAIKHFEGYLTDYEYEPIKTQRQAWRDEINELEKLI